MHSSSQLRLGAYTLLLSTLPMQQATAQPGGAEAPTAVRLDPMATDLAPYADGGDLLRSAPGVSAGRMGGHGLDPVIRGQSQNQINIVDSGSMTYGACPNRMDPPAATAGFGRASSVTVERGYQSVTHAAGGSGGAVILERNPPEFDEQSRWSVSTHAGAVENGSTFGAGVNASFDLGEGFYLMGFTEAQDAGNYTDGSGATVRSAYTQTAWGLTLGYARDGADLALDLERDRTTDVLFPGAGMDSPMSETTVYRLRGGVDMDAGALTRIEGSAYLSTVDHAMDNFTLRAVGMMAARTPSRSDTHGGKIEAQLAFGATDAKIGMDLQSNNRDAMLYSGPAAMQAQVLTENPAFARFNMWPDVTTRQISLYAESETQLGADMMLTLGARYDRVRASAGKADEVPAGAAVSPNTLYNAQYGTVFDKSRTENNLGGLARLDWQVAPGATLFFGASRVVRTADATERAMAKSNWIGNPDIAPEKHHQLDLGVEMRGGDWSLMTAAFVDEVDDYILRDAFSAPGMTTYRNVDARLAGIELQGRRAFGAWELSGDATWTYGQNRSDDRPLAQIPPLAGKVALSYGADAWRAGARVNWAVKQTRIDPARDPAATPGYATLDLFGEYEVAPGSVLMAGVANLTDRTYANHLSRANVFDPAMVQVNEPGRSVYLRFEARF
ncbi:TonB-dependent receptor domain-containing protein [Sediminimonas qiaohouensis]|nr:TonB-dependent receptor [Sediminimonas qiaohouensis]